MTSRPPTCIVLGGGGFLGTNLCRRLASSGAKVRAFGRHRMFPRALKAVEWLQGDFSDAAALAAAVEGHDIVFHLVHATTPYSANLDMTADLQQNVTSTLALLEISRNLGVRRIVFVSSGGVVYGPAERFPTPETAPTDPITAYGVSKLAIEKYLGLYEYLHGLDFRVLRVANPFGPFQVAAKNQGVIAALISRALDGKNVEIWGDGSVVRDYIFVDDVIDALETAAADRSDARIFNIGAGRGRSLRDVIASIEKLLKAKIDITWKERRSMDVPTSIVSIERARDVLGWTPATPFETGLERTIAWWRTLRQSGSRC
jgi:UDP-glucose 4-epimerase